MNVPLNHQVLAGNLYSQAQSVAAGHGRQFKPSVAAQLQSLMQTAASEALSPSRFGAISREKDALPIEARTAEATVAVQRLVDAMVGHAVTVPGYPADALGERTLNHALNASGLCPCWPIC